MSDWRGDDDRPPQADRVEATRARAKAQLELFSPVDGLNRPPHLEAQLADAFAAVAVSPAGGLVLDYLHTMTAGRALPGTASDGEVRHLEGQRWLVGLIDRWIAAAGE